MGVFAELGDWMDDSNHEARRAEGSLNRFDAEFEKPSNDIALADIDVFEEAYRIVITHWSGRAHRFLMEYLEGAINLTHEYTYPQFKNRLLEVFSNPNIISYTPQPYRARIDVRILATEIAGDVNEYMEAVRTSRRNYTSDEHASFIWREIIYKTAREGRKFTQVSRRKGRGRKKKFDRTPYIQNKYKEIIQKRLSKIEYSKAPYWYFLNYGSTGLSDDGGTAYPILPATNFIEKSEVAIETFMNGELRYEINRIRQERAEQVELDIPEEKVETLLVDSAASISSIEPRNVTPHIQQAKQEISAAEIRKQRAKLYKKWS